MPTLNATSTFADLASILHAAHVLGRSAWNGESGEGELMEADIELKLRKDLAELFRTLQDRQLQYLLVGGIAMLAYIDGRNTKDVDLLLSPDVIGKLPEIAVSSSDTEFSRGMFRAIQVDLLLTTNPLFKIVQDRFAGVRRFLGTDVSCVTVEGLIVLKLYALPSLYRQGDYERIGRYENDIFVLMARYRPQVYSLLEIVRPHIDESAFAELENIVKDTQQRIDRADRHRTSGGVD